MNITNANSRIAVQGWAREQNGCRRVDRCGRPWELPSCKVFALQHSSSLAFPRSRPQLSVHLVQSPNKRAGCKGRPGRRPQRAQLHRRRWHGRHRRRQWRGRHLRLLGPRQWHDRRQCNAQRTSTPGAANCRTLARRTAAHFGAEAEVAAHPSRCSVRLRASAACCDGAERGCPSVHAAGTAGAPRPAASAPHRTAGPATPGARPGRSSSCRSVSATP